MLKAKGQGTWFNQEAGRPMLERDSCQCQHCNAHIFVKPGFGPTVYLIPVGAGYHEEPGAWCACCNGPVCLRCHAIGVCIPFEQVLAELEGAKPRALVLAVP